MFVKIVKPLFIKTSFAVRESKYFNESVIISKRILHHNSEFTVRMRFKFAVFKTDVHITIAKNSPCTEYFFV